MAARMKRIGIDVEVNAAVERNRRSFSESENDILRRLLLVPSPAPAPSIRSGAAPPTNGAPAAVHRARGLWSVELNGARLPAANLKDAYRRLLLALAEDFPNFLPDFSRERARSRRFVARVPIELYLSSPDLARNHARPLRDGWWYDSNLSAEQVSKRARVAARLCGLRYGPDVRILDNLREI